MTRTQLLTTMLVSLAPLTQAATVKRLYTFPGGTKGANPYSLTIGSDGTLYGGTSRGGQQNFGTVFALTPPASPTGKWTESIIYRVTDATQGLNPSVVAMDRSNTLYLTATGGGNGNCGGGCGTILSLTPPATPGGAWTETLLHSFTGDNDGDGWDPIGRLALSSSGTYYGVTLLGGTADNGVAYSLTPSGGTWVEKVIYKFPGGSAGSEPTSIVVGSNGVLFGTAEGGGNANNNGVVFALLPPSSPGGAYTEEVLYTFAGGNDGSQPFDLIFGRGGVLYGTTYEGGNQKCPYAGNIGCGTVFQLTPPTVSGGAWTETLLHTFGGLPDGGNPEGGLVLDDAGVLWGDTLVGGAKSSCRNASRGCGTLFNLVPPASPGGAWTENILHKFAGPEGAHPNVTLVPSGTVWYGVTYDGALGTGTGCKHIACGTVFQMTP